jgi:hypothetical protein
MAFFPGPPSGTGTTTVSVGRCRRRRVEPDLVTGVVALGTVGERHGDLGAVEARTRFAGLSARPGDDPDGRHGLLLLVEIAGEDVVAASEREQVARAGRADGGGCDLVVTLQRPQLGRVAAGRVGMPI